MLDDRFGGLAQRFSEGDKLVFHPPPMTVARHIGFLHQSIRELRERGAYLVALHLKERAEEIENENPLPTPTEEQVAAILRRRQRVRVDN